MPIESLLVQLADVVSKIENVRSLLGDHHPTVILSEEDRGHINALLGRLNEKKASLEAQIREMTKKGR